LIFLGSEDDVINLGGIGIGTDLDAVVLIGDVSCDVISVMDTSITCSLGAREGGPANVEVLILLR